MHIVPGLLKILLQLYSKSNTIFSISIYDVSNKYICHDDVGMRIHTLSENHRFVTTHRLPKY